MNQKSYRYFSKSIRRYSNLIISDSTNNRLLNRQAPQSNQLRHINVNEHQNESDIDIDIDIPNTEPLPDIANTDNNANNVNIENELNNDNINNNNNNSESCTDIHPSWYVTSAQENNADCVAINFQCAETVNQITQYWSNRCNFKKWIDAKQQNIETEWIDEALKRSTRSFIDAFNSMCQEDKIRFGNIYNNICLNDANMYHTLTEEQHFILLEQLNANVANNDLKTTKNELADEAMIKQVLQQFQTKAIVTEFDGSVQLSKRRLKLPVEPGHQFYPFGSLFYIELAHMIAGKRMSLFLADWLIIKHHNNEISVNACNHWKPDNAFHLLWLYLLNNHYNNIKEIKVQAVTQRLKKQTQTVTESNRIVGYDPIWQDYKCMMQTPCHRVNMNQPISEWKKKYKTNPIHTQTPGDARGKYHISDTNMGKYMLWRFLERYTFTAPSITSNNIFDVQFICPGVLLVSWIRQEFMLVLDVLNDSWSLNMNRNSSQQETQEQWINRITNILQNLDQKNAPQIHHPRARLLCIPVYWKYNNCNNPQHKHWESEQDRQLFIKIDSVTNDVKARVFEIDDSWSVLSVKINNAMSIPNPNIDAGNYDNIEWWHLNWMIKENQTCYKCIEYNKNLFIRLMDPFYLNRQGYNDPNANIIVWPYYLNHDGFTTHKTQAGQVGFDHVLGFYSQPAAHLGSTTLIFNYGFTLENETNSSFVQCLEEDVFYGIFNGYDVEFLNDNNQWIKVNLRLVLVGFWNDGKENKKGTGFRGALNTRSMPYTSESRKDDLTDIYINHIMHWGRFTTQTV